MPTTTVPTTRDGVQPATYDTEHHDPRVLMGARIDGDPHLFDLPAPGNTEPHYLVERGLTINAELQAQRRLPGQGRPPRQPPNAQLALNAPVEPL